MKDFVQIDPKELKGNVFSMLDDGWALLSAGTEASFNTMTVSWGGLGWLWRGPAAFAFVRKDRYTYKFVEENDSFTLSFFAPGDCRDQLKLLGSRSGRDMDKMNGSGLTPVWLGGQPAFAQAQCVLVCKKLYQSQFDYNQLPPQVREQCYPGVDPSVIHVAYTSMVTACYVKE